MSRLVLLLFVIGTVVLLTALAEPRGRRGKHGYGKGPGKRPPGRGKGPGKRPPGHGKGPGGMKGPGGGKRPHSRHPGRCSCLNGGICIKQRRRKSHCKCPAGFTGRKCERRPEPKPCHPNPCKNGGRCKEEGHLFYCFCAKGFRGIACEVTPCSSAPCLNGGTCVDKAGGTFQCKCPPGYQGRRCENGPCHSSPCKNGGTCTEDNASFRCKCPPNFKGSTCAGIEKAVCIATGDPHYTSFDGRRYNFMGKCKYVLAKCDDTFEVLQNNEPCGNGKVTCTQAITVTVKGLKIHVVRGGIVTVDGAVVTPRYDKNGVSVVRKGRAVTITSDVGLTVTYNGVYNVFVTVSVAQCRGKLSGLCGNLNGDKNDDLKGQDATTFGNSWNVDPNCGPGTKPPDDPCKSNAKLDKLAKEKCSLLSQAPFDRCNGVLDPTIAHIPDCRYDVCSTGGATASVCEAYAGYSEDCAVYGINIKWRNDAKFSHCLTPCSSAPCLNAGTCVDKAGGTFQCKCPPGYKGTRCEEGPCHSSPCKNGGTCTEDNASFTCKCPPNFKGPTCEEIEKAVCIATGDPHYTSFDGRRYNFMGKCKYVLAKCDDTFEVLQNNEPCGNGKVTCTQAITVTVKGLKIHVVRGGTVTVDGAVVTPPYDKNGVSVVRKGRAVTITSDVGLTVTYNGVYNVFVTVSVALCRGKLSGLCGNLNGDKNDDLKGQDATTFGNSWNVDPNCGPGTKPPDDPCKSNAKLDKLAKEKCSILSQAPFDRCNGVLDPTIAHIPDCRYDVCSTGGATASVCEAYAGYSEDCAVYGINIKWRNDAKFSHCLTPCSSAPCLNAGTCVDKAGGTFQCKCPPGYKGNRCEEGPCHSSPCKNGGTCTEDNASFTCKCPPNFKGPTCEGIEKAVCIATGDPHYTSFDGRRYNFMGKCKYVLAKCDDTFEVLQNNEPCGNGKVTCTKAITVTVKGLKIHVVRGGIVTVDGAVVTPPYDKNGVSVVRKGRAVTITSDVGLTVTYNGVYNVFVTVSVAQCRGKLSGLCGNLNGDKNDDLKGQDATTFGNSWNVDPNCGPGTKPPDDPCKSNAKLDKLAKEKCSLLSQAPFDRCNGVLDPTIAHIPDCRYDVCSTGGATASVCEAYAGYSEDCAVYGININWRNDAKFSHCLTPCSSAPCLNAGTCVDKAGGTFQCKCPPGYKGTRCEEGLCHNSPCKNGGTCTQDNASFTCKCPPNFKGPTCEGIEKAVCIATGDPHYTSFDGKRYNFMGKCKYVLAKCDDTFEVLQNNEPCGNGKVTCTQAITVTVKGLKIHVVRGGAVTVDGAVVTPPYDKNGVSVVRKGRAVTITSDVGLTVTYNGVYNVFVTVSVALCRGKLSGLCGNLNGDKNDDLKGQDATTFGNSWNVDPNCVPGTKPPDNPCKSNAKLDKLAKEKCSLLSQAPFDKCNGVLDPTIAHIPDCRYDVCSTDGATASVCEAYAAYSEDCAVYGINIKWSNDAKFSHCLTPCSSAPCLNAGTCVDKAGGTFQCKCPPGYKGNRCEEEPPLPKPCDPDPCKNGAKCKVEGDSFYCICGEGFQGITCEEVKCPSANLDLLFVVDGSGSVTLPNFNKVKKFIKELTARFQISADQTRVAFIQFSYKIKIEFCFGKLNSIEEVNNAIDGLSYFKGTTFTGRALKAAREQVFKQTCGDRPNVPDVLMLFTDGASSDGNLQFTEAEQLKKSGVKIITVAMGKTETILKFEKDLKTLASDASDGKTKLTYGANFDNLETITNKLVKESCSNNAPN